jgi:hypothetical protein
MTCALMEHPEITRKVENCFEYPFIILGFRHALPQVYAFLVLVAPRGSYIHRLGLPNDYDAATNVGTLRLCCSP